MKTRKFPWRIFSVLAGAFLALIVGGFVVPGPIEVMWDPKIMACMCNSRNLVEFRNGEAFASSDHADARGRIGRYTKGDGKWLWEMEPGDPKSIIELYPTWFALRVVVPRDGLELEGHRILWPSSLKKARANLSTGSFGSTEGGP
jgi:hypothetical protein